MANFTVSFDVDKTTQTTDWATYRRLMEQLRQRLGVRYSHNLPVLPPQQNPPTRWFDIELRTNSRPAITLRIRMDNLYLDGYRVDSSGRWFEFGSDGSTQLIPGSTFLGFGGGYYDLEDLDNRRRERINLGQTQLTTAVNDLQASTDNQVRKRALIIVIQMICESIRYENISNHLATTFRDGSPPPDWMLALENGWGGLSAALLHADADPMIGFRIPQPNDMGITIAEQAVAVLGILVDCYNVGVAQSARVPRMVGVHFARGLPRVEVFSVCIDNIDGENEGQLYGTITVTDGFSCQYIYNRSSEDYESINPGNDALLTGPNGRTISACDSFTINVDLKDYDKLSWDDEVSKGQISWNFFDITNRYDEPLAHVVKGKYGSATVNYAVFGNAVGGFVEVTLVNGDGEDPADVYGDITASVGSFEKIVLFKKKTDERIQVHPGALIPLSRSQAAVPPHSSLKVYAELYDHDTVSRDDEIAKGTAEFSAQLGGTCEKDITGEYGKVRVKVTWTDI